MPSFGTVSLVADSATFVYVPSNLTGGVAYNVVRTDGAPSGFKTMNRLTRGPVNGNGVYKVTMKLVDPVVADGDTACGCIGDLLYSDQAEISFLLSEKSSEADRKALRLRMIALLSDTATVAQVDKLEYIWS